MGRLLKKYNSLSPTVKVSFWFVVCNAILKATQILTTPIYVHILSTTQFGEYKVFLSWVELAAIITTLDIFYSGYNVGMEKFREDREKYTSAMHGLCMALTTLWVVLLVPFAPVIAPLIQISPLQFRLLLLYMYIFPIFQFWSARKRYEYSYKPLLIATTVSSVFTILLGTLFALTWEEKSDGVIVAKIVAEAIVSIPLLCVSVKSIKSLFNKYYWKYALKFNIPLVPHYLSTMILNHSDVLMIDIICGKTDAGIYSLAYSIAILVTIIQNAVNSAIVPWMYKKLRERDLSEMSKVTSCVVGAMVVMNLMLVAVAPEAVRILGTSEYYGATYVIPPITFGVLLTAVYGLFVNVEFYFHYNKFAAVASVIAASSNIVLNYFFITQYGYIAAGYTTFASYLLLAVMHYFGLRKVTKKNGMNCHEIINEKLITVLLLGFVAVTLILVLMYEYIWLRYALILFAAMGIVLRRNSIKSFAEKILHKN